MTARLFYALLATSLWLALCWWYPANAHDAPSGWAYPATCCGGQDCAPVACDTIDETATGARWDGVDFVKHNILPSGDHSCHACVTHYDDAGGATHRVGRCLFILQGF